MTMKNKFAILALSAAMLMLAACANKDSPAEQIAADTTPPPQTAAPTVTATTPTETPKPTASPTKAATSTAAPSATPKPEHYYPRAWKQFSEIPGGDEINKIINARFIFADLDGDGAEEMIAYKEVLAEGEYISAPCLSIFDIEGGQELCTEVEIGIDYFYYAKVYLNALNRIIIEDNIMEGYFSYSIYSYENGRAVARSEERNGHEPDIEEWETENRLVRPFGESNPDYPFRYLGLGQLFHESYEPGMPSLVDELADDSEKMEQYRLGN